MGKGLVYQKCNSRERKGEMWRGGREEGVGVVGGGEWGEGLGNRRFGEARELQGREGDNEGRRGGGGGGKGGGGWLGGVGSWALGGWVWVKKRGGGGWGKGGGRG